MPTTATAGHLPHASLVLAVAQAVGQSRSIGEIQEALWREDPAEVAEIAETVARTSAEAEPARRNVRAEEAIREARKAAPMPRGGVGLTVGEIADRHGLRRETLAAALEHHGFLEAAPYGGTQRRRLVSDTAIAAGLGCNVEAGRKRVAKLEGHAKAATFPIFYADRLAEIFWCLDFDGLAAGAARIADRRERLAWLLDHHGYLPADAVAELSGYSLRAVRLALADRATPGLHSQVIEGSPERRADGFLTRFAREVVLPEIAAQKANDARRSERLAA